MAIITQKITSLVTHDFTMFAPGSNNTYSANIMIPASAVNLDLLTLCTEDTLWALQPSLDALIRGGFIVVTGTIDTAQFDYTGVGSITADANPSLRGSVNFLSGTNVTFSQVGQDITINAAGGSGSPAGANTQLQFNNSGAFGASSNLTWDGTTLTDGGNLFVVGASNLDNGNISTDGGGSLNVGGHITVNGDININGVTYHWPSADGALNDVLTISAVGIGNTLSWIPAAGSTLPAGVDGQIQFNNSGAFGADSNLTYVGGVLTLGLGLSTPAIQITTAPTAGYVLTSDVSGNGTWQAASGAAPGGTNTAVQFNNSDVFAGDSDYFSWDDSGFNLNLRGPDLTGGGQGSTGANLNLTTGAGVANDTLTGGNITLTTGDQSTIGGLSTGGNITLTTGIGHNNTGGSITLTTGQAGLVNVGGSITLTTGPGPSTSGGSITLTADNPANGGNITLTGTGSNGLVTANKAILTALQVTTAPTAGYVLTSDAGGNGTWQAASGGSSSPITPTYSISLPTNTDFATITNAAFADALPNLSFNFWINTTSINARIFGKTSDNTADGGWSADILAGGQFALTLWQPAAQFQYVTATVAPFNDGVWHNVLMTYDSVLGSVVYIDGVLVPQTSNTPIPGTNYVSPNPLGIGDWDTQVPMAPGHLAHFQIWNTTLTLANAQTLATGGSIPAGLIASWAFSEGTGITAADTIGGNTLTFTAVNWNNVIPGGSNGDIQINVNGSFGSLKFTPTFLGTYGGSPFTTSSTPSDTSIVQSFTMADPTHRVKVTVVSDGYQADALGGMDAYLAIDGATATGSHLVNYGETGGLTPGVNQNSPVHLQWIFTPGDILPHTYSAQYASSDNASRVIYPNVNATMIIEEII